MARNSTPDVLNPLLRGEISAVETYQQAMEKIGPGEGGGELRAIHAEHIDAANQLRRLVHDYGGETDHGSGAWGAFAKAVEGTAKVFGNAAALKALKEGEEHGIASYERALGENTLPAVCQELIRFTLLPQTRQHVQVLDHLLEA